MTSQPVDVARRIDDATVGTVAIGERTVRRLGFGTMRVSGARNAAGVRDRDEGIRLVQRAYERGITLFDTADIYGYGQSEEIIAAAFPRYPDDLLITSKAGFRPGKILPGHATLPPEGTPSLIIEACEGSLRRLRVECIDVYQVHVPDPRVPYADTVGAFVELQQAGKIRHIGISNVSADQLELARSMCDVVSVENRFNAADRATADVLAICERDAIAFLPWQPTGLAESPARRAAAAIAAQRGVSLQQVALAWLLGQAPVIVPIPGTSDLAHLDDNIDAAWLTLSDAEVARLERASRPPEDDPAASVQSAEE